MKKLIAVLLIVGTISCNKSANTPTKTTTYYLKIESVDNDNSVSVSPIIPVKVTE
jgi:hypothetical protein